MPPPCRRCDPYQEDPTTYRAYQPAVRTTNIIPPSRISAGSLGHSSGAVRFGHGPETDEGEREKDEAANGAPRQ